MDRGKGSVSRPLQPWQAVLLLVAYCLIYVLPLYGFAATRAAPGKLRDAPEAIRARIRAVSLSTTLCSLATFTIIYCCAVPGNPSPWRLMGIWPVETANTVRALLLTGLLFAGPLYESLVIDGVWRAWTRLEPLYQLWSDWAMWRNIVAGPITEECLFRSAAVPLLLVSGCSPKNIVFLSPCIFGLAHLHHFYEFRITHPQTPLVTALARSALQLSYTTIFGVYATFIFLRTGSLAAVVAVHTLCNSMGLPRVWGGVEPYWLSSKELSQSSLAFKWTMAYYVVLLAGSVLWWQNINVLTESTAALITI